MLLGESNSVVSAVMPEALAASWRRMAAMWASPRSRVRWSRRNWMGSSETASSVSCSGVAVLSLTVRHSGIVANGCDTVVG